MRVKIGQVLIGIEILSSSGIETSPQALAAHIGAPVDAVVGRLIVAAKRGLVEHSHGSWWITCDGRDYLDNARTRPYEDAGYRAWIDAAETGILPDGRRADIENPAIPRCGEVGCDDGEDPFIARVIEGRIEDRAERHAELVNKRRGK